MQDLNISSHWNLSLSFSFPISLPTPTQSIHCHPLPTTTTRWESQNWAEEGGDSKIIPESVRQMQPILSTCHTVHQRSKDASTEEADCLLFGILMNGCCVNDDYTVSTCRWQIYFREVTNPCGCLSPPTPHSLHALSSLPGSFFTHRSLTHCFA